MPYAKEVRGKEIVVFNKDTGAVKGHFPNTPEGKIKAQKQMNLLYGIEGGWHPTGKK